jgi:hypothetical protein
LGLPISWELVLDLPGAVLAILIPHIAVTVLA